MDTPCNIQGFDVCIILVIPHLYHSIRFDLCRIVCYKINRNFEILSGRDRFLHIKQIIKHCLKC